MNGSGGYGGKGLGGFIGILVVILMCVCGLFAANKLLPNLFHVLIWVIIIAAVVIIALLILILVLANKSGKSNDKITLADVKLDEEQTQILSNAKRGLMDIRRKIMQIHVMDVRKSANKVCSSLDKILLTLNEKPEKIKDMRQCLNYYIPTLHDVLGNFNELEDKGQLTDEMSTKTTGFLKDVRSALEKRYDGLYSDEKLDMEVDMEAMTLALKREGLL